MKISSSAFLRIIPEDEVIARGGKRRKGKEEKLKWKGEEEVENIKKKKEKPIRVLRIKYYEKLSLPVMKNGKLGHKDIFAVNRGLEGLLKELYFNIKIEGMIAPSDCIYLEKDDRIGNNDKFIFIEISKDEFGILKRQLENHTTIYAFNMGELSILEGRPSFLSETWNIHGLRRNK